MTNTADKGGEMSESCTSCRFVRRDVIYDTHRCRRFPPQTVGVDKAYAPAVSWMDWCAEFRPVATKSPTPNADEGERK